MTGSGLDALLLTADLVLTFVVVKGAVVVLCALAADRLWKRASAADRAALWGATTAVLLVVPMVGLALPLWSLEVLAFPRFLWQWPAVGTAGVGTSGLPAAAWLGAVWAVGTAALLLRFAVGLGQVVRCARRGRPTGGRSRAVAREVAATLGLGRPVRLVETSAVASPASFGWRRPVILLPAGTDDWPAERLRAVLLHELAHAKRADWLVVVVAQLLGCVFWMNPLVWLALARLRFAQDRAADDAALRAGMRGTAYATSLLEVARLAAPSRAAVLGFALGGERGLRARVGHVLDPVSTRGATRRAVLVLLVVMATAGGTAVGRAQLWRCPSAAPAAAPIIL